MPKPRNSKVESASQRLKLEGRRAPYWTILAPGIALGYRRNEGAGSWVVRSNDGRGAAWTKRIATADDLEPAAPPLVLTFWQAQEAARNLARKQPGAPDDEGRPVTVREALTNYENDLKARGASTYNARAPLCHLTDVLLAKPVQLLSAAELKKWRHSLIDKVTAATINRMLKPLRAALKLAAQHDQRIQNQAAWKTGLQGLPDAVNDRNVILPDDKVRALIGAAYKQDAALGLYADVLAGTGARPSQAARLTVADLISDPRTPRLMMPRAGKGGSRNRIERKSQRVAVPITLALAQKLKDAAGDRADDAPLLLQSNGLPWGKTPHKYYSEDISTVIAAIELDAGQVTMYALRHSSIVRQLLGSVPIRVIASTHDTSVAMIERHYSRYITDHSDELSRRALLHHEPDAADNDVVLAAR